ncbi:MAG: MraY family glycosyltransferase [Fuerstiella sp.]
MSPSLLAYIPTTFSSIASDSGSFVWSKSLTFLCAFVVSVIAAPLIARAAMRFGVVDAPDGNRKLHDRPIPLTGGPTLCVAVILTLLLFADQLNPAFQDLKFLGALFVSSILIVVIGVIDDRSGLRGRQKLAGQALAGLILLPSGISFESISLFGQSISFGDLSVILGPALTLVFLIGAINALNLIDGVDGLACTTGIVLSLSIAAVSYVHGRTDGLMISLVLAGALSGFLVFNFPPARMFLGDSGSMLIGLVLGAVAVKCSLKQHAAVTLVMPTAIWAIWAIPLFDVSMAIVRRKLTGRSIYETDRGHMHHCLERKGLGGRRLLLIVAALCGLTGLAAVVSASRAEALTRSGGSTWIPDVIAVVGVLTAVSLLVLTRSFGHTEMSLLSRRIRRLTGSMLRRAPPIQGVLHDEELRLHGDHNWQQLWETLTSFAERFEMDSVELMVNLPRIGEEYHASWKRRTATESHEEWKSEIPLIVDGMRVGCIRVVGAVGEGSICKWMSDLIGGLQSFENELISLIEDLRYQKLGVSRTVSHQSETTPPAHAEPTEPRVRPVLSDSEQFMLPT